MSRCVLSVAAVALVGCTAPMPQSKLTLKVDPDGNGVDWVLTVSRSNLDLLARQALKHPELGSVDDVTHRDVDMLIGSGLRAHGFADCPTTPEAVEISNDGLTLLGRCQRALAAPAGFGT